MAKALTFGELIEYARQNYTSGGDGVYECWDERTFDAYVKEFGAVTKAKAKQIFRLYKETEDDEMGW